ncbi:serine/threonine-protein kinase [Planomonospora sp. ID82291]|uniref:serine/threonine-protein kinase n=1 Tax=Planomonospora sp. ID82291 TaxID=2738136 RepID=UPI001A2F2B6C|nr:serine/threonine-protein kinase [Planomonospora sp. ID82291]MBG0817407.1 serine/threonine protein kinase [Planomonospora sp. ID82291]
MQSEGNQEGRRVAGRYHLLEPIGRGGMGTVWKAHDELLDRTVAIKEVRYSAALGEDVQTLNQRLLREARAAARLTHPNVVVVYDVIEENAQPWIVMQLVPSRSLGQVLREDGPLPPRRVAEIGLALLGALQSAHDAGVLHRDVKPENVLLAPNGRVVLTDFGIAKLDSESTLTMTGVAGTPAFIAPERLRGLPARRESDLWSLGATLYAAVEGRSPHDRKMPLATMHSVMTDPPDPARNAGPLLPVLEGLLRKEPVQRLTYAEASAMLRKVTEGRSPTQPWLIRPAASSSSSPAGAAPAGDGPPAPPERRKPYGTPAPRPPATPPPPARPAGGPAVPPARERPVTPPEREGPVPPPGGGRTDAPAPRGTPSREQGDAEKDAAERAAPAQQREAGAVSASAAAVIPQTGQVVPPSAAGAASSARDAASPAAGPAEGPAPAGGGAPAVPPAPAADSGDAPPSGDAAQEAPAASGDPSAASEPPSPSPSPDIRKYVRSLVPEESADSGPPAVPAPAPRPEPVREADPADQERTRLGTGAFAGGTGLTAPPGIRRALPIVVGALVLVGGVGVWIGMNSGDDGGAAGRSRPSASAPAGSPTEPGGSGESGEPGGGDSSQTPSSPTPSPSKSEKTEEKEKKKDGSKLPSGWRMHKDPNGFSVGLPKGWKVERRQGTQVRFRGPDDRRSYLMIEYTDSPGPDSKKDWDVYEPQARGGFPGYKRIRIEKVDYMEDAADWEFTWEPGYGKVRVLNRGFITKGGRGYAIYWHTPASKWKKNLKLFEGFAATFSSKK